MSKIICDICGTTYPSSSECCPICGCSNATASQLLGENMKQEDVRGTNAPKAGSFSKKSKKREIFDFDEEDTVTVSQADEEEVYDEEEEEAPRHNTFVVILLTVLIVVLLGAAAFIFIRFFLPNMTQEETVPPTTVAVPVTETTAETTEPTIPCQQMVMTNAGEAKLSVEGQQFLLHIKALPENTTDKIIYTSADESIATVTEDGKITAVSEGETTIYISCGTHSIECTVVVEYVEETVPPTTEAIVEETVDATAETEVPAQTENDPDQDADGEDTDAEDSGDTGSDGPNINSNVTLKLKKTDIRLAVYYEFRLELDCELSAEDVTWSSEHPYIAKVDETGNVTAVQAGTTSIIAKYGDQEVQCIVRCF